MEVVFEGIGSAAGLALGFIYGNVPGAVYGMSLGGAAGKAGYEFQKGIVDSMHRGDYNTVTGSAARRGVIGTLPVKSLPNIAKPNYKRKRTGSGGGRVRKRGKASGSYNYKRKSVRKRSSYRKRSVKRLRSRYRGKKSLTHLFVVNKYAGSGWDKTPQILSEKYSITSNSLVGRQVATVLAACGQADQIRQNGVPSRTPNAYNVSWPLQQLFPTHSFDVADANQITLRTVIPGNAPYSNGNRLLIKSVNLTFDITNLSNITTYGNIIVVAHKTQQRFNLIEDFNNSLGGPKTSEDDIPNNALNLNTDSSTLYAATLEGGVQADPALPNTTLHWTDMNQVGTKFKSMPGFSKKYRMLKNIPFTLAEGASGKVHLRGIMNHVTSARDIAQANFNAEFFIKGSVEVWLIHYGQVTQIDKLTSGNPVWSSNTYAPTKLGIMVSRDIVCHVGSARSNYRRFVNYNNVQNVNVFGPDWRMREINVEGDPENVQQT